MENDFDISELGRLFLYITYLNFSLQSVKTNIFEFSLKITHTHKHTHTHTHTPRFLLSWSLALNVVYEEVTDLEINKYIHTYTHRYIYSCIHTYTHT